MFNRFLPLLILLSLTGWQAHVKETQPTVQPNILWIFGEDMGVELSLLDVPEVHTPNIDALAQKGMYFTQAFTTAPVCSPARSAINTGMYQMAIGAHNHRSHRPDDTSAYPFPLPDGVQVISDHMRHAGYFTANIREMPEDAWFRGTGKTDWNFTYAGKPFDSDKWADLKNNQPFYAQVNFPETHRGKDWNEAHEHIDKPADPDNVVLPSYYPDHPVVREDWAQYLNAVMALDRKVGDVLSFLERDGLAKQTIVVFMADHGRAMVRGKQWPYDSGLHVPMLIYIPESLPAPEGYSPGSMSSQLVHSIDMTATTIALAGSQKPPAMQGRVLFGPQMEPPRTYVFGGRDRGDETVDRIRTVRSRRFRYIRNYYPDRPLLQMNGYKEATYETIWVMRKLHQEGKLTPEQAYLMAPTRPTEELYDVIADPYEINNLASSADHHEILRQLSHELDGWMTEIDDQGRFPEPASVQAYYEARMIRNYAERINALHEKWGIE
ncbi:MAG: sulfatase [Bacteroidota bacterium]